MNTKLHEIITHIINKDFYKAKVLIHEAMNEKLGILLEEKLLEYAPTIMEDERDDLIASNKKDEARVAAATTARTNKKISQGDSYQLDTTPIKKSTKKLNTSSTPKDGKPSVRELVTSNIVSHIGAERNLDMDGGNLSKNELRRRGAMSSISYDPTKGDNNQSWSPKKAPVITPNKTTNTSPTQKPDVEDTGGDDNTQIMDKFGKRVDTTQRRKRGAYTPDDAADVGKINPYSPFQGVLTSKGVNNSRAVEAEGGGISASSLAYAQRSKLALHSNVTATQTNDTTGSGPDVHINKQEVEIMPTTEYNKRKKEKPI